MPPPPPPAPIVPPTVVVHRPGREREPVVVIDDFAADPFALRDAAVRADFSAALNHYPGIRAPLPEDYLPVQLDVLAATLREVFGAERAARTIDASFSIVTTPADALTVPQRLPHCDAFAGDRIALVHYLAPDRADGTAFYRHRATGFETIDEDRAPIYFGQLDAELRHGGVPAPGYVGSDTPLFERVAAIDARFNRAVLYRSRLLHSGSIAPGAVLSADPAVGRLTVTAFLSIADNPS